jgi:hypothetical protein
MEVEGISADDPRGDDSSSTVSTVATVEDLPHDDAIPDLSTELGSPSIIDDLPHNIALFTSLHPGCHCHGYEHARPQKSNLDQNDKPLDVFDNLGLRGFITDLREHTRNAVNTMRASLAMETDYGVESLPDHEIEDEVWPLPDIADGLQRDTEDSPVTGGTSYAWAVLFESSEGEPLLTFRFGCDVRALALRRYLSDDGLNTGPPHSTLTGRQTRLLYPEFCQRLESAYSVVVGHVDSAEMFFQISDASNWEIGAGRSETEAEYEEWRGAVVATVDGTVT